MDKTEIKQADLLKKTDDPNQRGSAIVIAVFILVLLSAFVALALSRTATEASAVGNEMAEGRTFYAAQGSLEMMTRNFNKVFEVKLSPADTDFDPLRGNQAVPGFTSSQYTFNQEIDNINSGAFTVIEKGAYAGLFATRDNWRLRTTATDPSGIQIQLTRNIQNNRIPIFQFGIFYNDDMEIHPGPRFDFGGRVHSNASIFMMSSGGIYFSSRVSAVGEVLTDVNRNGRPWTQWGENVYIKNGSNYVQLFHDKGSALSSPANGTALFRDPTNTNYNPDMPTVYQNTGWNANQATFGGNLLARQKSLDLPLKIASTNAGQPLDYVELIKRGKSVGDLYNAGGTPTAPIVVPITADKADSDVTVSERYYDKTGIRVNIADSKAKLPGCASGVGTAAITGPCGVRLDGASTKPAANALWLDTDANGSRGYQPLAMADGYQATRLNGERIHINGREVWIKVELVSKDTVSNSIITKDVTEDILSLGVTEPPPFAGSIDSYGNDDSRSIIKLQRFATERVNPNNPNSSVGVTTIDTPYMTYLSIGGTNYNVVKVSEYAFIKGKPIGLNLNPDNAVSSDDVNDGQTISLFDSKKTGTQYKIVPFPIEMFDSREGVFNVDNSVFNANATYGINVPWAGVMSMVDVDIANLKSFLDGTYNTSMPTATDYYSKNLHVLRSSLTDPTKNDVPQNSGWVVYVSDRRGDSDFDGEYDMEDIFGNNDGIMQPAEDINGNKKLDTNYINEAVKYTGTGSANSPAYAASIDHPYYRRGVRLINGERLPGIYDAANSANTRGFTFASENSVYVQGNYNANFIASVGTPTPYSDYGPVGAADVPASVVGDSIYILSNSWQDSRSFLYPYDSSGGKRDATETHTRFALIAGDSKSSFEVTPNQGSGDVNLSGGVHNFKRFLEDWSGTRLNYCGSLINLYNAHNNNGSHKSSTIVYDAPNRNWVFDSSFLDPTRLPPGTPYFQYVQVSGFQRTNN